MSDEALVNVDLESVNKLCNLLRLWFSTPAEAALACIVAIYLINKENMQEEPKLLSALISDILKQLELQDTPHARPN